ncbi:MAG: hypothetical protein ACUVSK_12975, partial [Desulfotomaculales bacterium]
NKGIKARRYKGTKRNIEITGNIYFAPDFFEGVPREDCRPPFVMKIRAGICPGERHMRRVGNNSSPMGNDGRSYFPRS